MRCPKANTIPASSSPKFGRNILPWKRWALTLLILLPLSSWAYNSPCRVPLSNLSIKSLHGISSFKSKLGSEPFLREIQSAEQFIQLAKIVSAGGEARVVKVLIDNRDASQPSLYFMHTDSIEYHYNFAREVLGYRGSLDAFNRTYESESADREFIQASLVIRGDGPENRILIETWNRDALSAEGIKKLHDLVKAKVNSESFRILYHPLSQSQEEKAQTLRDSGLEYITTEELFKGREYLSLNEGMGRGYLKFARVEDVEAGKISLGFSDIVIFDEVPATLGLVGGVITEKFQTPLSHVNVKSINRGTINLFLKNAREKLKHLEGKPIEIQVRADGYEVIELPVERAETLIAEYFRDKRPKLAKPLTYRRQVEFEDTAIDLRTAHSNRPTREQYQQTTSLVGAKASNMAVIDHVLRPLKDEINVESPGALGFVFNYHDEFLNQEIEITRGNQQVRTTLANAIRNELEAKDLLNPDKIHKIETVSEALKKVRALIEEAQVPQSLLNKFQTAIMTDTDSPIHISKVPRIRLRSSTNAEDLDGFTGAGLYDSYGVGLYKKLDDGGYDSQQPKSWKKIEKKLKEKIPQLYSAVWNDRAFMEREFFSMNGEQHMNVRLAILSHMAFPGKSFDGVKGELGNGVAITKDIYNPEKRNRVYLNSQHNDFSVTNPPTRSELEELGLPADHVYRTEEIVVATEADALGRLNWRTWEYETIGTSSLEQGKPVLNDNISQTRDLSEMEIRRLSRAFYELNRYMARLNGKDPGTFSIDSEWKLYGPERKLLIKQARPFQ